MRGCSLRRTCGYGPCVILKRETIHGGHRGVTEGSRQIAVARCAIELEPELREREVVRSGCPLGLVRFAFGCILQRPLNRAQSQLWAKLGVEWQRPCRQSVGASELRSRRRVLPGKPICQPPYHQSGNGALIERNRKESRVAVSDNLIPR